MSASTPAGRPLIVVHGGAWDIKPWERLPARRGCEAAAEAGYAVLRDGGTALDAVQRAIVEMEDNPAFDAGLGAFLNVDGFVELDAALMRGSDLQVGAVAAASRVRNPIRLARSVLDSAYTLIAGDGTASFARAAGVPLCDPRELVTPAAQDHWQSATTSAQPIADYLGLPSDTVGAVAIDGEGALAAGTSTGGLPSKPHGRVGDVPIVGAGVYADDGAAAVSATGTGEIFVRLVWAYRAASLAEAGMDAQQACARALELLGPLNGLGGMIMIDRHGHPGVAFNTPSMAWALRSADRTAAGPEAG